jgi:hypothetical protein
MDDVFLWKSRPREFAQEDIAAHDALTSKITAGNIKIGTCALARLKIVQGGRKKKFRH